MKYYLSILLILLSLITLGQENEKKSHLEISGMVSGMPSFNFTKINEEWTQEFLLHNRFDIEWTYDEWLKIDCGIRNRFITGDRVKTDASYTNMISKEQGFLDLTSNWLEKESFFFNTAIDRLSAQFTFDKLEVTIGRQRINWGITSAWNPNDIFNAYSYFDFDYAKHPGTDAIRIKYYTSFTSVVELAANIDSNEKVNIAAYHRFNYKGTDIQMSGGIFKSEDMYFGLGWSGFIGSLGVKGENSIFIPYKNKNERETIYVGSFGLDYSFTNSLYIMIEGMYNSSLEDVNTSNLLEFFQSSSLDARRLSFSPISWFASASYPISPIINTSLAGMYFPNINGFYIIPSIEISLTNSTYLSFIAQTFNGDIENKNMEMNSFFFRLKTNF